MHIKFWMLNLRNISLPFLFKPTMTKRKSPMQSYKITAYFSKRLRFNDATRAASSLEEAKERKRIELNIDIDHDTETQVSKGTKINDTEATNDGDRKDSSVDDNKGAKDGETKEKTGTKDRGKEGVNSVTNIKVVR